MRLAIISDIHGNIDALLTVLADADSQDIDEIICLGDIVGYGAEPAACLSMIRERCSVVVMGNHDYYTSSLLGIPLLREDLREHVVAGIALAREQLSDDQIAWLGALPMVATRHGCTFVHSSLSNPEEFPYLRYEHHFWPHFAALKTPVCFTGHTHWPSLAIEEGRTVRFKVFDENPITINGVDPASFDIGSVGQPRDEDPRSSYAIFDTETLTYYPRRIGYDIAAAQQRIRNAGLPDVNADRLSLGQ